MRSGGLKAEIKLYSPERSFRLKKLRNLWETFVIDFELGTLVKSLTERNDKHPQEATHCVRFPPPKALIIENGKNEFRFPTLQFIKSIRFRGIFLNARLE